MLHERNGTSSPRSPRTSSRSQRVIIHILYILRILTITRPALQSSTPLPAALRDLYRNMSRTTDSIVPSSFLQILRQVCSFSFLLLIAYTPQKVNPQFAETDRSDNPMNALRGLGYAQQGRLWGPGICAFLTHLSHSSSL